MGVPGMWPLLRENGCIDSYSGDRAREWLQGKRIAIDLSIILAEVLLGGESISVSVSTECNVRVHVPLETTATHTRF